MSHLFKIGDKCRYIYDSTPELIGKECEIIWGPCVEGEILFGRRCNESADYVISFAEYDKCLARHGHLEPLQKPNTYTVTTWAQVPFGHPAKYLEGVAA